MADEPKKQDEGSGDGGGDGGNEPEFKAPATQAEFDRMVSARIARERGKFADYEELKSKAGQFDQLEEKNKTELERATTKATAAEQRASSAEAAALRLEVALDKAPDGMPIAQVRKLAKRVTGSTREEMEADAEDLFADFTPSGDGGNGGGAPPSRKPTERLKGGTEPEAEPEPDTKKVLDSIPRL